MTLNDLKRLRSLNREIEYEKKRLHALKKKGDYVSLIGVGMVSREEYSLQIKALEDAIKRHIDECMALYNEINQFISSLDDPFIRLIISLKHVNGLEWEQIAMHIGGGNTAECIRKAYSRFVKKHFSSL